MEHFSSGQAAAGQFQRIQQLLQSLATQTAALLRHVNHRTPIAIGFLGDVGSQAVADLRIQRSDQYWIATNPSFRVSVFTVKSLIALSASSFAALLNSSTMSRRLPATSGNITLS